MDEKHVADKVDEIILPGFRFHPTDEELVGFYLKKKIQQQPLPIELIKQVDIYKYDPWDLPKLSATGEKEWYFYCLRDRKYRNSARPNRVTGSGFWKATGTDRPICSSDGSKCIGLKKSLVFYRGRAAKGAKTNWMMHEFRLPSLSDSTPSKKLFDKSLLANDSWAICRIFKKANSIAQRALWMSPLPEPAVSDIFNPGTNCTQLSPESISCITALQTSTASFPSRGFPSYEPSDQPVFKPSISHISMGNLPNNFMFSPLDLSGIPKPTLDVSSMILNLSSTMTGNIPTTSHTVHLEGAQQQTLNGFTISLLQDMQGSVDQGDLLGLRWKQTTTQTSDQWTSAQTNGFPISTTSNLLDSWKPDLSWDSRSRPSELSTGYSSNKRST
ncbi:hypothetical protein Ancab_005658 [Ancistrocladus abbreviatus]